MRLNLRKLSLLLMIYSAVNSVFWLHPAIAQVAEVPNPKPNGDFSTAFQRGNRGFYKINKWLVVQSAGSSAEDYALNCRYKPNGQIRSQILRGAIITAVFKEPINLVRLEAPDAATDAIVLDSEGSPWLRVQGSQDELAYPVKPVTFQQLGECYVKANLKFIAPINPDSLMVYNRESSYCKSHSLYCQSKLLIWLSLERS